MTRPTLPRSPRPPFPHFRLLALASLFLLAALSLLLDMREAALAAIGGDTLALVHPSPGPLNLLGWGLILSAALSSLGKIWPP